jgi:hypothetical protein
MKRSIRVTVAITVATIISTQLYTELGSAFFFWEPLTIAFIVGGVDGGVMRITTLRLIGTLIGAMYGYLIVQLAQSNVIAVGLLAAVWSGAMQVVSQHPVSHLVCD